MAFTLSWFFFDGNMVLDQKAAEYPSAHELRALISQDGGSAMTTESFKSLYAERFKRYTEDLSGLTSNLLYQFVFMLVAYVVLAGNEEKVKLPILGMDVKVTGAICLALGGCFFFLWLKFGFIGNGVIEDRICLWRMGETLENGLESSNKKHWPLLYPAASCRKLLDDGGLMDAWFRTFLEARYGAADTDAPGGAAIVAFAGLFLGVSNGCMLGMMWEGYVFSPSRAKSALLFAVWLFLLVTHSGFLYFKRNPNWMQVIAMGVCLGVFWTIRSWSRMKDRSALGYSGAY